MQELIERYNGDSNKIGKIELAAMTLLNISDEMENTELLQKSKLRQDGLRLLQYVQKESNEYSIQRDALIKLLETNG